jgi:hypothetical protein
VADGSGATAAPLGGAAGATAGSGGAAGTMAACPPVTGCGGAPAQAASSIDTVTRTIQTADRKCMDP